MRWMVPFAMALREVGGASLKTFPGIPEEDVHNIQTHASYMAWLVSALLHYLHQFWTFMLTEGGLDSSKRPSG